MVTTVAPTIPVLAASSMPTIVTEMPSPPRSEPNNALSVSRSSSAIRARSNVMPIKTNSGTAISVSLVMMPKSRLGKPARNALSKPPPTTPANANKSAVPPRRERDGKAGQQQTDDGDEHE